MSAFCAPLSVSRARAAAPGRLLKLSEAKLLPRRVRAVKSCRVSTAPVPLSCVDQSVQKPDENEEPLDEAAMRAAEIHEVLTGLRDFKTRIIDDATKLAKKVRAPKKELEAALAAHPDIIKIDGHIAELEEELKVLGDR